MKDLKISKELFNEVTNSDCHEVFIKDEFIIAHSNLGMKMVNLYEFAFIKCKEWAKTKKMYINSIYNEFYWDRIEKEYFADIPNKNKSFYADTEVEALFKAYEWILKEIKDK